MGNREDLLSGAKRCLLEKGYDRITVRDITTAAGGVSMAAIGYHFGSREELLTAALLEALEEWGAKALGPVLAESATTGVVGQRRFEDSWDRMIETFTAQRKLWLASVQAFVQGEHSEEIRKQLAAGQQEGRRGMVASLKGIEESEVPADMVRSMGSVQMALISGLMMQWLNDPESAPTGAEIAKGLRELVACLGSPPESGGKKRGRGR